MNEVTREELKNNPMHVLLKKYYVISIVCIAIGFTLQFQIWFWYQDMITHLMENGKPMPNGWDVALLGFAATNLGLVWKAVNHIQSKQTGNPE